MTFFVAASRCFSLSAFAATATVAPIAKAMATSCDRCLIRFCMASSSSGGLVRPENVLRKPPGLLRERKKSASPGGGSPVGALVGTLGVLLESCDEEVDEGAHLRRKVVALGIDGVDVRGRQGIVLEQGDQAPA